MTTTFKCPKCPGMMRTYTRANVQIEQCDNCRGIFLDYGELEAVNRAEQQYLAAAPPPAQAPPPQQGYPQQGYPQQGYQQAPAWQQGGHHGHHRQRSFGSMFFST